MKYTTDLDTLLTLNKLVSFAEQLPMPMLTESNTEPIYPITASERLVSFTLGILLEHEWENTIHENASVEVENSLTQLDMGVNKSTEWEALFEANKGLSGYISELS